MHRRGPSQHMDVFKKIGQEESSHSSGAISSGSGSTRVTIAEREGLAGSNVNEMGGRSGKGMMGGRGRNARESVLSSGKVKLLAGFGGLFVLVLLFSGGGGRLTREALQREEVSARDLMVMLDE